jgi:hypothetical protein
VGRHRVQRRHWALSPPAASLPSMTHSWVQVDVFEPDGQKCRMQWETVPGHHVFHSLQAFQSRSVVPTIPIQGTPDFAHGVNLRFRYCAGPISNVVRSRRRRPSARQTRKNKNEASCCRGVYLTSDFRTLTLVMEPEYCLAIEYEVYGRAPWATLSPLVMQPSRVQVALSPTLTAAYGRSILCTKVRYGP